MTLDGLRKICLALPDVVEDVKWEKDLCFCVGGKMFAAVNLEKPHQLGFKCTPDDFAELVERPDIIPAPYMAKHMWVQETELGAALERRELEALMRSAYELVVAKLPKARRPGEPATHKVRRHSGRKPQKATARAKKR